MPYGASPEEWAHWVLELGLTRDLLPVVCQPGLPISPTSKLTSYGKVPSRLTRDGHVIGFPAWTSHLTTDAEVSAWMQDDRLGICLQTREIRALDLDLSDVTAIQRAIDCTRMDGIAMPIRARANSPRCLLLFRLPGAYPKQVLPTASGVIELLATGQQCLVAGTHKDGARYTWRGGLPTSIPTLTDAQLRLIQQELRTVLGTDDWSEGWLRKSRDPLQRAAEDDPMVAFLRANGWVRS